LPLKGGLAYLGDPGRYALNIAQEEINRGGGILGRPLEIDYQDTGGSATEASILFSRLPSKAEDRTVLTTLSAVSLEVARLTENPAVPTLQFVLAIHPDIVSDRYKNVRICYNALDEAQTIVTALKYGRTRRLATLVSIDSISSIEYEKHIRPELEDAGFQIVADETFNLGEHDFRPVVRRIADSRPSAVLLLGYGSDFIPLMEAVEEFEQLSSTQIIGGIGFIEIPDYVDIRHYRNVRFAGPAYLAGPKAFESGELKEFVAAYRKQASKEPPPYDAIFTFDSIMLWKRAVETVGTTDPMRVLQYLRSLKSYRGLLGDVPMNNGDAHPSVALMRFAPPNAGYRYVLAKH
jgi:branched-chain amino acid transport system substrate-binding protein